MLSVTVAVPLTQPQSKLHLPGTVLNKVAMDLRAKLVKVLYMALAAASLYPCYTW